VPAPPGLSPSGPWTERGNSRIGIRDLGPPRLQHSYVTLSHTTGGPLEVLQEQCGPSSVLVTQSYITPSEGQRSQLADRFASA
jgi:integrase